MTQSLYQLVYCSHTRIRGGDAAFVDEVRTILASSRRNNAALGITGALMFNAGCFAQVLEGTLRTALEHTFERIQRDPRHDDVLLLAFAPAASRGFGQWSMAFVGEAKADRARYAEFNQESGFDPAKMTGEALFAVLHRMVLEEQGAVG